ncbi:MAG: AsmA family protein, partial [Betaproteobacteria bacterium]|nr:AsmA family protein [Betaproteobacteria bacterium]
MSTATHPLSRHGPFLARARAIGQRAWTPHWLEGRPRPLRIAIRTVVLVLLALFLAWLVLFVTKGRFLKHPFESIASSTLEREVTVGGDFNL